MWESKCNASSGRFVLSSTIYLLIEIVLSIVISIYSLIIGNAISYSPPTSSHYYLCPLSISVALLLRTDDVIIDTHTHFDTYDEHSE